MQVPDADILFKNSGIVRIERDIEPLDSVHTRV
jgi:hypothetical protein